MIRGSTATATLWSSAASSCCVRVPSTEVAAASTGAVRTPSVDLGTVTGIATETLTGACSKSGYQVIAERSTAKASPAVYSAAMRRAPNEGYPPRATLPGTMSTESIETERCAGIAGMSTESISAPR